MLFSRNMQKKHMNYKKACFNTRITTKQGALKAVGRLETRKLIFRDEKFNNPIKKFNDEKKV